MFRFKVKALAAVLLASAMGSVAYTAPPLPPPPPPTITVEWPSDGSSVNGKELYVWGYYDTNEIKGNQSIGLYIVEAKNLKNVPVDVVVTLDPDSGTWSWQLNSGAIPPGQYVISAYSLNFNYWSAGNIVEIVENP
jgi:hypothetical protein